MSSVSFSALNATLLTRFFVSVFAGTAPEFLGGFDVKEMYVYLIPSVIALIYFIAGLVYYLVNIEKAFSKLTK